MSFDTAKKNVFVADSSVKEWKQDLGNLIEPESSSSKTNEDGYLPSKGARCSTKRIGSSAVNKEVKQYGSRYFIIKSLNHQNIELSVEKGIWATQVMNEPILDEAFHNSSKVILIFSVNMSGFFQGYAQMMSSVGWRRDTVWSQGKGHNNPWGRSFKVKWLQLSDLPFHRTLHLKNPLNDCKPVKISRDCQELPNDIGEALCDLLDESHKVNGIMNRCWAPNAHMLRCSNTKNAEATLSSFWDEYHLNRPGIEPPCSMGDGQYGDVQLPWTRTPMHYPSILYHNQAEGNIYPHVLPRSGSPLASTLNEDDLLDMSYEEYLEAHSRRIQQFCNPATGRSRSMEATTKSKQHDDDINSSSGDDQYHRPYKKSRRSSNKCNSPYDNRRYN